VEGSRETIDHELGSETLPAAEATERARKRLQKSQKRKSRFAPHVQGLAFTYKGYQNGRKICQCARALFRGNTGARSLFRQYSNAID
jgi:hypothetical protein